MSNQKTIANDLPHDLEPHQELDILGGKEAPFSHLHKFTPTLSSTILSRKIIGLLVDAVETTVSPWAIVLVRFQDQNEPLPPLTSYQDLFTTAGNRKLNMVD